MRNQLIAPLRWLFALTVLLTLVAVPAPAGAAASDCPSTYFCAWSATGYTGTMRKFKATDSYRVLGLTSVRSYYNNRSKRTWLHATADGSGTYSCIAPGAKKSSTTGWQSSAKAVWLSTTTNC